MNSCYAQHRWWISKTLGLVKEARHKWKKWFHFYEILDKAKLSWQKAEWHFSGSGGWWEDCFQKRVRELFFWMVYRCPLSRLWWSCLPRVRICQIHWTIFLKGMPLLYINYVNKVDLNRSFPAESTVQPVWRIAGLQLLKTHLCPCCLGQHPAQCQVYNSAFSSQGPLLVVFFFFF